MRFLRILISIVVLLLLNPLEVFADTIDNIELTDIEKQWIAEEHIVKVRVSYYPPFQFNQQKLEGLSVDIIKHIFNENNIKYELVSGAGHPWSESLELIKNRKNFDLLLTASISEERKSFLTFSDKYLQLPWVIFTRNDTQSITTIDDLKDKIVSTPEAFLIKTLLEEQYPKINLKTFGGGDEIEKCLIALSQGEVDAFIGGLAVGTYFIKQLGLANIKVAGQTPFGVHNQSFAVRSDWPELVTIINKSLKEFSPKLRSEIFNKWVSVDYELGFNKKEVFKWILILSSLFGTILLISLFWNKKLKKEVQSRKLSENKFNLLFQNNPSPVILLDASDLTFKDVNKRFTEVSGFTHDEVIGKTAYSLGLFNDNKTQKSLANILKKHGHFDNIDEAIYTKKGVKMESLHFGESIDIDNKQYYLITILDLTEQKQNHQQLGYLLTLQNKLRDFSTLLINMESDKISQAFKGILKEIGELYGADRTYVFEYDFEKNTVSETYEWCSTGTQPQFDNLQNIDLANSQDWLKAHTSGKPVCVSSLDEEPDGCIKNDLLKLKTKSILAVPTFIDNELVGFVGVDYVKQEHQMKEIDIEILRFFGQIYINTMARIKYENTLKKLNYQLTQTTAIAQKYAEESKRASNAKSEFLATMSHEIRTPLNGVIGFTDLLADTELSVTQRNYITYANKSALSLLNIINDILDFSKIEAGKLELEYLECEIYHLFDEIIDLFKIKAAKKGIELFVDIDSNLPNKIIIDNIRFKQVLVNLISNAVKFTDKGYVKLIVEFQEISNKGILSVKVVDSGVGIHKCQVNKLFKAFSQADTSVTRKFGGTGLGLIISNNIINLMGGNIEFSSTPNVSTTFEFSIELDFVRDKQFSQEMTKNIHKILLIEQDSASVSSIQKMLLFWRYITTVSYSLAEALEIMKKEKFDLLLVAYVISDEKDFFYLDVIKKELNTTSTPILLVDNERTNTTLKDECKRIDLGTFITKPIRQTNLFKNLISIDKDLAIGFKPSPSPVKIKYRHKVLSHNKYSILIAEDNKLNLKLIKTILLQLLPHACIDSAANGIIAKDRATIRTYDIIFMDLQMPEMDGITSTKLIIKELKSNTPPIIALTANATQEDKEMCYKSGMIGFLTKPIIKDNLIKILNSNILRK